MTQEPKQEPAHLKDHRAVILFRSALVGAASLLPVPGVTEALTGALRRGLMRHVTSLRHVDIEDEAVDALLSDTPGPRRFTIYSALSGAVAFLKPRRALRRMVAALQILHGIEEGTRMFQLATLVDHYCTMHHLGPSISVDKARRLRRVIDETLVTAQRELAGEAINQIATQAGRLLVEIPGWVWGHIKRTGEPPALPSLAGLSQTTHALIANLSVRRYLGRLTETFDRKWSGGTVITVN